MIRLRVLGLLGGLYWGPLILGNDSKKSLVRPQIRKYEGGGDYMRNSGCFYEDCFGQ